jgi:hypothetical protein
MSSFAYFLARDTIDHFNTVVKPVVYLSMFYYFSNPRSTMADNYTVLLALVYCVTGIGYTLAFCFNPASGQLVCIILIIIPIPILASGGLHHSKSQKVLPLFRMESHSSFVTP